MSSDGTPLWLRGLIGALGAIVLLMIGIGVGFELASRSRAPQGSESEALPVLWTAPSYTLENQLGHGVDSSQFDGKVQVVTFLFPYCRTYCPLITAHLIGFEHMLQRNGFADKVQLVAFNLAGDDAGTAAMQAYLKQYGWNPQDTHLQYLSGTQDEIRKVVRDGYHVAYQRVEEPEGETGALEGDDQSDMSPQPEVVNPLADQVKPGYDITHNDALMVVDSEGRVRKVYDEADVLSNDSLWSTVVQLLPAQPGSGS